MMVDSREDMVRENSEVRRSVVAGLGQSAAGQTADRGDFAQFASPKGAVPAGSEFQIANDDYAQAVLALQKARRRRDDAEESFYSAPSVLARSGRAVSAAQADVHNAYIALEKSAARLRQLNAQRP
jgi:hypothetical protein